MKKMIALSLCLALALTLCACGNNTPPAGPEENVTPSPEKSVSEPTVESTLEPTDEPTSEPESVHPYAWLGYEALPDCKYMDCIAAQVFYREYDLYVAGYVTPCLEASDGRNTYSFDGNNISLTLDGMVYAFNERSMIYMVRDMTGVYPATLEARKKQMKTGTNATGRVFQGTGNEPVPLYCDESSDSTSYDYYEFLIDGSAGVTTVSTLERVYFKDGDVFAIWSQVTIGEKIIGTTQVITAISGEPDPALLALPANFDDYEPYE